MKFESAYEKRILITYATSKGSYDLAHKCSLARVCHVRIHVIETFGKLQASKRKYVVQTGDCACAFEKSENRET